MDWKERAQATEDRLRGQFLASLGGDAVAYHRFLEALATHLRAFFRKRLFQLPDEVEDMVQETLMAVHAQRHTYRPQQPLTAWIHTMARYKMIDLLRARSVREALHDPIDDELQVFAASDTDAVDARRDLETLLLSLPPRQRRALRMTKVEGASVAETALALGMSEVAVKVGIHRSLKTLAARFRSDT